jgi:bis(5'-nucleosyl)-tetraphosphatase (symmetrical)
MTRYAIGDIQGCYEPLMQLINKIDFNPSKDLLYLVGDLVNRGPKSLEVLKWIYKHQDSIVTVLGNHDIYLLARYCGIREADTDETIADILHYEHASKLIDWLRSCPLVYYDKDYILVHAGIHPSLDFSTIIELNDSIQGQLKGDNYAGFINKIYGNKPNLWDENLSQMRRMKFMVNASTRMRFLNKEDSSLNYKCKGDLVGVSDNLIPWFKVAPHSSITKKILFGHWAALGFHHTPRFIALDTGCVWHQSLTAINLDSFEIIQINNNDNSKNNSDNSNIRKLNT